MLNELYSLSGALSDVGIETKVWHREYKQLPNATAKAPCFRIWITKTGSIKDIDELDSDLVRKLRKFGNNQASFPAFNIRPLYRIIDEHQKKALEEIEKNPAMLKLDVIRNWLINDNWLKSMKNIDRAIHDMSGRMFKAIEHCDNGKGMIVTKLIQSVNALEGGLRSALESYILSNLEGENSEILLRFLLHSGDENKSAADDMGKSISVILDIAEWEEYGYPIASEDATVWINDALIRADEAVASKNETKGYDAFGSPCISGWSEPMPSVKLSGFDVTLRAMFHEQRCQQRYGELNDGSYPIAKENRVAAKQALEWMAEHDNEGITWKRADKDEIVFAYPSKLTPSPMRLASVFGPSAGKESENKKAKARFEDCAKDFIKSINGISPKMLPEYIRIFSIRKMDKARSKVVLTRNCSSEWFVDAAKSWQSGCANIPEIDFVEPSIPYPLEVAQIVNNVWKRDGKQITHGRTIVKRMQYYQGIELLLDLPGVDKARYESTEVSNRPTHAAQIFDCPGEELTRYYMRILLANTEGLINYIGNSIHSGVFITPYYSMSIAKITAVLGLLLYNGGCIKEVYMQNTAYLLGQLLKASDELHTFYCKVERNGDVPPQLVGNSVFGFASETPFRALAQISISMQPYISWARRYKAIEIPKNKVANGLVGWNLKLHEDISSKLAHKLVESTRFNEFDKAQLFLGYLASFPKSEKTGTGQIANVIDNNLHEEEYSDA